MEAALVAMRLVQFAAAMVLLGSPVFGLAFGLRFPPTSPVRQEFDRWLRRMLLVAALAALASAALWLDFEAAIMGDGWDRALDPGTVRAVLLETEFGHAWCWHLGLGGALLAVVPFVPLRSTSLGAVGVLGAAFVASLAWAGHAVMHPGVTHVLVMGLHLLAAGLWLGSLPALFHLIGQARRNRATDADAAVRYLLPLYSRAGYGVVALVLLTGIVNSAFLVGSAGALVATAYGRTLLIKIALVLAMVGLAARNRFWLMPAAVAHPGPLWRSVRLELGLGGLVLAAVSLLGTLPPALRH